MVTAINATRILTLGPELEAILDKVSIAKKNRTKSKSNVSTPNDLK